MKTLLEYMKEINESDDSTHYASIDIDNTYDLYKKAMKTKNSKELEKAMIAMKNKFPDSNKINFKNVDWEDIFIGLNESEKSVTENFLLIEGRVANNIEAINKLIDKAIKEKDAKTLKLISAELDKILKEL